MEHLARRCYRWFLRGFANSVSLELFFAFLSARFSKMDFPDFFAPKLLGDFPDTEITTFPPRYFEPYALIFLNPVRQLGRPPSAWQLRELPKKL